MSEKENNSGILSLIQSFSPKERKYAMEFLQSPYFNKNPRVIRLFQLLSEGKEVSPERLSREIFPDESVNDLKMRHLSSELLALLEKYLATEAISERELLTGVLTLESYKRRGMTSLFSRRMKTIEKLRDQAGSKSSEWYYENFRVREAALSFNTVRDNPSPEMLPALDNALDQFWCLNKIKYGCSFLSYRQLLSVEFSPALMQEALALASGRNWLETRGFAAWYHAWYCLAGEGEAHFADLKESILTHSDLLPADDLPALTLIAINFCIERLNKGSSDYLPVIFALYQKGIESKALLPDGNLSPWTFKNIISSSLRLKEFEWAERFIPQYGALLPPEFRTGLIAYSRARVHFEKKEFAWVRRILLGIHIRELFTLLDARVLEMQACYEAGDRMVIESLLENFTRLLRRKKMLSYHQQNYQHFKQFLSQLIKLPPGNKVIKEALLSDVQKAEPFTYKSWFVEQLSKG